MPAGHDNAVARIPSREEEALRAENVRLTSALGELQGKWDSMVRHEQVAIALRSQAQKREESLVHELKCTQTQVAQLQAAAAAAPPAPVPVPAPAPTPAPAPAPAPAPKMREYK